MLYGKLKRYEYTSNIVLILIFLENALRHLFAEDNSKQTISLNPYFFGKCSTAIISIFQCRATPPVLILIFLENALRRLYAQNIESGDFVVLILIFLENALRLRSKLTLTKLLFSLNPYFFGKCSTA